MTPDLFIFNVFRDDPRDETPLSGGPKGQPPTAQVQPPEVGGS